MNVALIVTAAGVGTVGQWASAFQDLLRNVLAGIWLLLQQPFRLGDTITVLEAPDPKVAVQNITLRTTTLRTGVGELAILPNLTVFTGIVINSEATTTRAVSVSPCGLPAGVDLADLMQRSYVHQSRGPGHRPEARRRTASNRSLDRGRTIAAVPASGSIAASRIPTP